MINDTIFSKEYMHYISLGYNCYVASDLEKLGLRDSAYPFDWIKSDWTSVEFFIRTNFENFLIYDNLYQHKNSLSAYIDKVYNIDFLHDFDKKHSLKKQLDKVRNKYMRRAARFYESAKSPTLFIRYIRNENELEYLKKNYSSVIELLKSFCADNDIVFICSDVFTRDEAYIPNMVLVKKMEEQEFIDNPIMLSEELTALLKDKNYPDREKNLTFLKEKEKRKESERNVQSSSLQRRIKRAYERRFLTDYVHSKQC